jgi:hypothetical protein
MTARGLLCLSAAGLFAGAAAWAMHQQVGYIEASWACGRTAAPVIWLTGAVATVVLLTGTLLSALALRRAGLGEGERPHRFMATVSLMAAALFLFALALQAVAALFLPGCIG